MLTHVTTWEMSVGDMCTTAAGDIAIRMGSGRGEIQLCDRKGRTHTKYPGLCTCGTVYKYISEVIPRQYMAELCWDCNEIKVVDMVTHKVHRAYSGSSLSEKHVKLKAMCSGPGEGSLLVSYIGSFGLPRRSLKILALWEDHSFKCNSSAVIQLQWNETTKKLDEIRWVQVPGGDTVFYMCYMPRTDLLILSRDWKVVQAVKLQECAGQPPVWQLQGEVLGKWIDPYGVSCDSEGRVYVVDGGNSRLLSINGSTGEVVQELLLISFQDASLGGVTTCVEDVCCLSNPHQLLVNHYPSDKKSTSSPTPFVVKPILSLYNITSL